MTASTLDTASHASAWGAVSNAEPHFPIDRLSTVGQAILRAGRDNYFAWLDHVRPAAGCTRPIRLTGTLDTLDPATGQRLGRLSTADLPDGHLYKACGNRRATVCPSCADTYRRDAYQLLRAGLVGGKGVPDTVATHDAVFPTFTAPSFGPVHTRVVRRHSCVSRRRCDCRPDPCHPRRDTVTCPHGQPAACFARHDDGDPRLGRPLCLDCYDHDHQVVWNHFTGELWRRTKQNIERYLARLCRQREIPNVLVPTAGGNYRAVPPVRVAHGKAAEFQIRGAVHFHALLRLDGVDPLDPTAVVPPPAGITAADLDDAIYHAAAHTAFTTPPHPDKPEGWRIAWGEQVVVKHITMRAANQVTDEMVAGYLAKYATKSTEVTGHRSARLTSETIGDHADPDGDHIARLLDACWRLGRPTHTPTALAHRPRPDRPTPGLRSRWTCTGCGKATRLAGCPHCTARPQSAPIDTYVSKPAADNPYAGLRRWAHMLGFGGHFLTKARRYSVTFQLLRDTRVQFRRTEDTAGPGEQIRTADHTDEGTTLVVGALTFAGVGWHTFGDALLANTAAAMARARHATGREELAHEIGTALMTATTAAE